MGTLAQSGLINEWRIRVLMLKRYSDIFCYEFAETFAANDFSCKSQSI